MMFNYISSLLPFDEFRDNVKKVTMLHKKHSDWKTTTIRMLALIFVFCNFPLILLFQFLWNRIARTFASSNLKTKTRTIPGSLGLPMMGETLSYQIDRQEFVRQRYQIYGPIFKTCLDFSGSFLMGEEIVVCFDDTATTTFQPVGTLLGYCGFFGYNSNTPLDKVAMVASALFNDRNHLDQLEAKIDSIIQQFLYRLSFEQEFAFAEKINELACELTSTILLGMTGYSPRLQHLLDSYLLQGQLDETFHSPQLYRDQIQAFIQSAIREEDRLNMLFSQRTNDIEDEDDHNYNLLKNMMKEITSILETEFISSNCNVDENRRSTTTAHVTNQQMMDFIFILMADVFYRSLVQHLRSLLFVLLTNKRDLMVVAITALEAYHNLAFELSHNRDLVSQIKSMGLGMGPGAGGVKGLGRGCSSGFRWSPFLRNDREPFMKVEDNENDALTREFRQDVSLTSPLERVIHAAWHLMGSNGDVNDNKDDNRRHSMGKDYYQKTNSNDTEGISGFDEDAIDGGVSGLLLDEEDSDKSDGEEEYMREHQREGSDDESNESEAHNSDADTVDIHRKYRNHVTVDTQFRPEQDRLQIQTSLGDSLPTENQNKSTKDSSSLDNSTHDTQSTPPTRYDQTQHLLSESATSCTPKQSQSYANVAKPQSNHTYKTPPKRQEMNNKQRERLNIASKAYCRSVEDIAECAQKAAILPPIPLQCSLYRINALANIKTTMTIHPPDSRSAIPSSEVGSIPVLRDVTFDLRPGDLLCMINHLPEPKASAEQFLDLGLLGKLIVMSFTHELLANYRWRFERNFLKISSQLKASPSFTTICNAAFVVSGFHKKSFTTTVAQEVMTNRELYRQEYNIPKDGKESMGRSSSMIDDYISDGL